MLAQALGGELGADSDAAVAASGAGEDHDGSTFQEWLKVRLHGTPRAELEKLLQHAHAVLVLSDPQGMVEGRYWPAGSTTKRTDLHAAPGSAVDHVRLLVRSTAGIETAARTRSDMVRHCEEVVAHRELLLGPDHPDTLAARANLGLEYIAAGRPEEANTLLRRVLADRERLLGPDHADTTATRAYLVFAQSSPARTTAVTSVLRQVLADRERRLGPDHPDALAAREDLTRWTSRQ